MKRLFLGVAALLVASPAAAWNPIDSSAPTWSGDELPWRFNSAGSQTIPSNTTVLGILDAAYSTWESPACSGFRHDYLGTTSAQAGNTSAPLTPSPALAVCSEMSPLSVPSP